MKKLKLYLETSVWSFYFTEDNPEKMQDTKLLFDQIDAEYYDIFISQIVILEIDKPQNKKLDKLLQLIYKYKPVELDVTGETYKLADKYIKATALPENSHADAMHAAITSMYNLDVLLSWNCRHLVNLKRKNKVNAINLLDAYKTIEIITPSEVIYYV
jgi:predicted nucleic acid-binding protein